MSTASIIHHHTHRTFPLPPSFLSPTKAQQMISGSVRRSSNSHTQRRQIGLEVFYYSGYSHHRLRDRCAPTDAQSLTQFASSRRRIPFPTKMTQTASISTLLWLRLHDDVIFVMHALSPSLAALFAGPVHPSQRPAALPPPPHRPGGRDDALALCHQNLPQICPKSCRTCAYLCFALPALSFPGLL